MLVVLRAVGCTGRCRLVLLKCAFGWRESETVVAVRWG